MQIFANLDLDKHIFYSQYTTENFHLLIHIRVMAGLESIPVVIRERADYTLERLPVYCRPNTERQTTIHAHIHSYKVRIITYVFGPWQEAKVPAVSNPHRHSENMQTHLHLHTSRVFT